MRQFEKFAQDIDTATSSGRRQVVGIELNVQFDDCTKSFENLRGLTNDSLVISDELLEIKAMQLRAAALDKKFESK